MNDEAAKLLADLLVVTANRDDWRDVGHVRAIAVDRVLAWAWNPGRLARAAERLAEGDKAPPIHVHRYWLGSESWYVVSDGHHRTVAARQAGVKRIRASISGEYTCEPGSCYLDVATGRMWRRAGVDWVSGYARLELLADGWTDERGAFALSAGVHDLAEGVSWREPT